MAKTFKNVRVQRNKNSYNALRTSQPVRATIEEMAKDVVNAFGPSDSAYEVSVESGKSGERVRAGIWMTSLRGAAMETKDRSFTSALYGRQRKTSLGIAPDAGGES